MKQRIAAFTLIWAYVACALWLFNATPHASLGLYLFPPGYFFVAGLFFGILNESLASRLPRLWVVLGLAALSLETGVFFYNGHPIGLLLGLLFAAASLCASLATKSLATHTPFLKGAIALGILLVAAWLTSPFWQGYHSTTTILSPDGTYRAWVLKDHNGEPTIFQVGPRYGWHGAFGRVILECGVTDLGDDHYEFTKLNRFSWYQSHNLYLTGVFPKDLSAPSTLLPIPIHTTQNP